MFLSENFRIYITALSNANVEFPLREKKDSLIETNKATRIISFLDAFEQSLIK